MTIGEKIKEKRIELELSQESLGAMVGVGKSTINKYELGVITGIPSDRLLLIAESLKTSPAYFMGWKEKEPAAKNGGELRDVDVELILMLRKLTPEQEQRAKDFVRGLLASR